MERARYAHWNFADFHSYFKFIYEYGIIKYNELIIEHIVVKALLAEYLERPADGDWLSTAPKLYTYAVS